ncbi:MAG TPA: ATP-binding protein [Thermoanaerobaculia bacterium]|nr:ATP-binding protein [Thermoanaerobaculia bacterium]
MAEPAGKSLPVRSRVRRGGLRNEALILLPAALLLMLVLSTFTLFAYRSAIARLVEERRAEAAELARSAAGRLVSGTGAERLVRELSPAARGMALLDAAGATLDAAGDLPPSNLLTPLAGRRITRPVGVGPDESTSDAVAGFAPVGGAADRRYVRVDLAAGTLAEQLRAIRILSVVVLTVESGLLLLALLFVRRLLAPFETLLARARKLGEGETASAGESDEVEFLLATFERALETLARRDERGGEDDIAALERTLSASLESGLLLLGSDGRVLALNAVGAALLGTAPAAPGAQLADLLAEQPELLALLAPALGEGRVLKRQECTVRAGAQTRTLGLTTHPLRRDDGQVRGYLVLFADLTEARRRAEESRLADSLARLGEMAGGIAHELRNSLATLRGYLTLIERRPDEESIADYISEIRREADHLQRVLEDFLAFARPGTARLEDLSLAALARRAAADPVLSGCRVEVRAAAPEPRLRGDPQLLERALRNLLHNAAQAESAAGRSGPLHIGIDSHPDGIELTIDDTGPGLPPEVRARLFHPFVTTRPGGVGLGLALAHRIITLHGGTLHLEPRPTGGTRARLFFPPPVTSVTEGNTLPPTASAPTSPSSAPPPLFSDP